MGLVVVLKLHYNLVVLYLMVRKKNLRTLFWTLSFLIYAYLHFKNAVGNLLYDNGNLNKSFCDLLFDIGNYT
jgi:hypothetical protein